MPFEKGHLIRGGRKKGSKNRINKDIRSVFHQVYEEIGSNRLSEETGEPMTGHEAMVDWARNNPTEFYRLYGKMIPTREEQPEDMHEDFIDDLVLEDEIKHVEAIEVGEIARIMPPSGEETNDNATPSKNEGDLV
jgi:hypothetical protein